MSSPAILSLFLLFVFAAFWVVAFFILYHLVRFGVGPFPKRLAALFLAGAVLLSTAVFLSYSALDLNALLK